MDTVQIAKSTQEQGIAEWIDYLNQLRLNEFLSNLFKQDMNLEQALSELQKMKDNIDILIESDRGGQKGLFGYIAECAEVGIENARNLIKGLDAACKWVNDNGSVDILRNGVEIQQKFGQSGGHFCLEAIRQHLEKYPDFIQNGGRYQIPRDLYGQLQRFLAMSQEEAAKGSTSDYRKWKWIQTFFKENPITSNDIEPAVLNYSQVQKEEIRQTIQQEKNNINTENQRRRNRAYEASKPTLKQGTQTVTVSAVAEGGMTFCLGVWRKLKNGKCLAEFTAADWKEIGIDTTKGTIKGGIRGATVYAMTNFTATSAAIANAFVTASFGVVAQAYQLQRGNITTDDFIVNAEVLCLDVSISAVASMLGQTLIPVPILGAIIGNVAGMFMYQIAKDHLSKKEQMLVKNYQQVFADINKMLEKQYQELIAQLEKELAKYTSILELAFNKDANIAFNGSIALADYVGANSQSVLRDKQAIDNYFLN